MLPRPSTVRAVRALQSSLRQASTTAPRTQLAHTVLSGRFIFRSTQNLSVPHIFRSFHLSSAYGKGISPETSDPQPKSCPKAEHVAEPASISTEEYHEIADSYIEDLVSKLEQLQEEREDVDCEYSVRVHGNSLQNWLILRFQLNLGWCSQCLIPSSRNIRLKQTASEQADLAQLAHLRP